MSSIAIVGMACVFPDARTPAELWENVLAQRRAFRRLPPERLRLEDYFSATVGAPDATYSTEAAVIEGYEFDRVAFRVVGSTFRSADLAHWLALDVAARALVDAGFAEGRGLPREATGVLLGNTLTGEFSRANTLRLRWPYVRRVVEDALAKENWTAEQREKFLAGLEEKYKAPFPPVGEETLAGGLSNTIAGRICNHFDLKGGGYTLDGACSSSLLAVAHACSALAEGDLDVALAGGVDLSLDPFELVGFARIGALAAEEMRVFDRRSAGFWPGEGCGFVTLMRHEDALAQGSRVYAVIRGWGISSDGSGGITRPETDGQLLALRRAYRRAGFGLDTVGLCECHGTGTSVGDATELEVLSRARRESRLDAVPVAIGSIKANIGHTKAAAGVAGLLKATLAAHTQVLPPTTGCEQPHPLLLGAGAPLRVLREAELWPADTPLRASVSAMGFGGINAHIVLESPAAERRRALSVREQSLARSNQDCELFLLAAPTRGDLRSEVEKLRAFAAGLSRSEMADLAAHLAKTLAAVQPNGMRSRAARAAIVASRPAELAERLETLAAWAAVPPGGMDSRTAPRAGEARRRDEPPRRFEPGISFGEGPSSDERRPSIALLFPGQGSPVHLDGGIWQRRFKCVGELYAQAELPAETDTVSTRVMQPAIVTASLAALRVLREFGVAADAAIGHSLGELVAAHWAEALSEEALLRVARVRGTAMAQLGAPTGAMLAVRAPAAKVQELLSGEVAANVSSRNASPQISIVGYNSPQQTVVAGDAEAVNEFARRASVAGWSTTPLPVSHAFHTPLVAAAAPVLADQLACEDFAPLRRRIFSTVTGALLDDHENLRQLFCRQVTSPVQFSAALAALLDSRSRPAGRDEFADGTALLRNAVKEFPRQSSRPDLFLEAGPGTVLADLAREATEVPVISLDAGGPSLCGLFEALGAAFVLGAPLRLEPLFADRFTRGFALDRKPKFFVNPCELAPVPADNGARESASGQAGSHIEPVAANVNSQTPPHSDGARLPFQGDREPECADGSALLRDAAAGSTLEMVRGLVAERAELPLAAVRDEHRMLSDLHLNSISVAQLVAQAARRSGLRPLAAPTDFADASVAEMARALDELKRAGKNGELPDARRQPPGVDVWFETFEIGLPERPRRSIASQESHAAVPGAWQVFAPENHPFAEALRNELAGTGWSGVLLCLPEAPHEAQVSLLLDAARAVASVKSEPRFVLVQHGWGGAGFARTLHLETPGLTTCVVNVPAGHPRAVEWIRDEVVSARGYSEAHFDAAGRRREPQLTWLPGGGLRTANSRSRLHAAKRRGDCWPVGARDVVLVTGGGKGIGAECALALGRATGAKLALLGRSNPTTDKELAANLSRFSVSGVHCRYYRADVTDAGAVRAALAKARQELGPFTGLLHAAGVNAPQLVAALEEVAFRRTLAPKIQGLRNVVAALDADRLRLCITFGSIIGRFGLRGEADYATANEWLTAMTEQFQAAHSKCRCLVFEWSVWSGVGMGERLGRMETLIQQGVMPIPPDEGVRLFLELLQHPPPSVAVVVTGRFGQTPTLRVAEPELPLHRFLEKRRVHYPGVELIVDAELSVHNDPYLNDHVLQKQKLFPAVLGLEAMAEAAMALTGAKVPPSFERVELARPVVVTDDAPTRIRLAALRRGSDLVEVCLRCAETDFHVDHFRAVCRFAARAPGITRLAAANVRLRTLPRSDDARLALDPPSELYGRLLFHEGRFRRLRGYRLLTAKECVAEILPDDQGEWFGRYLPPGFVLGDPAARDAALHAIQACIPHLRLLPTGIERFVIRRAESGSRLVHARQRSREGNRFTYDVEVTSARGELLEQWQGLRLRALEALAPPLDWPLALLATYVGRRLEELVGDAAVRVVLERAPAGGNGSLKRRRADTDRTLRRMANGHEKILRRQDGKPLALSGLGISASHAQGLTLAVAGPQPLACDLEGVVTRPETAWRELLGEEGCQLSGRISREAAEDSDIAGTRLWSALECLKKAGQPAGGPLVLETLTPDGWAVLRSGALAIATCAARVKGLNAPLVVAVALKNSPPVLPAAEGARLTRSREREFADHSALSRHTAPGEVVPAAG